MEPLILLFWTSGDVYCGFQNLGDPHILFFSPPLFNFLLPPASEGWWEVMFSQESVREHHEGCTPILPNMGYPILPKRIGGVYPILPDRGTPSCWWGESTPSSWWRGVPRTYWMGVSPGQDWMGVPPPGWWGYPHSSQWGGGWVYPILPDGGTPILPSVEEDGCIPSCWWGVPIWLMEWGTPRDVLDGVIPLIRTGWE